MNRFGDTGQLRSAGGAVMDVTVARSAGGFVLHAGNMTAGMLRVVRSEEEKSATRPRRGRARQRGGSQ